MSVACTASALCHLNDLACQIPLLELLLILALYSSGPVQDRVKFCFEAFDDDGNGSLDQVCLTAGVVRMVCSPTSKVGRPS